MTARSRPHSRRLATSKKVTATSTEPWLKTRKKKPTMAANTMAVNRGFCHMTSALTAAHGKHREKERSSARPPSVSNKIANHKIGWRAERGKRDESGQGGEEVRGAQMSEKRSLTQKRARRRPPTQRLVKKMLGSAEMDGEHASLFSSRNVAGAAAFEEAVVVGKLKSSSVIYGIAYVGEGAHTERIKGTSRS